MLLVKRKTRLSCIEEFSNIFLQSKAMCILFWFENKMASSHVSSQFQGSKIKENQTYVKRIY